MTVKTPSKASATMRRINRAMWAITLFFVIGYGFTYLARTPIVSLPLAALAAMWVGMKLGRAIPAAVAGLGLGAIAGVGSAMVLVSMIPVPRYDSLPLLAGMEIAAVGGASFSMYPMMVGLMMASGGGPSPEVVQTFVLKHMVAAAGFCAFASGLTGYLGQRRHRRIEEQWRA